METYARIFETKGYNANRVLAKVLSWFRIKRTVIIDTEYKFYTWTHASVIGDRLQITKNPTHPNSRLCEEIKLPKNKYGWKIKSMIGNVIVLESDFR
ncbi:MAG: hypothetical protein ACRBG0_19180 [Lewinella sp.]|uniref:hypothetical protein n=1 Tax=Lewinella sp. TaxID=2004506 RepID=UPI003D6AE9DC